MFIDLSPSPAAIFTALLSLVVLAGVSGFMLQFACYALGEKMPSWRKAVVVATVASIASHMSAGLAVAVLPAATPWSFGGLYGLVAFLVAGTVCSVLLEVGFFKGLFISLVSRFITATVLGVFAIGWTLLI